MCKEFGDYFNENMGATGVPTISSGYATLAATIATYKGIQAGVQLFGSRVTVGELVGAGLEAEFLTAAGALLASYYAGAMAGSIAVAAGRCVADGSSMADAAAAFAQPFQAAKTVVCPLILDLDGNGVQVTTLQNGVHFDHDGTGFAVASAWVSGQDGLLAWDKNGDGQITTGNELFGVRTQLKDGTQADNGFEVLASYDDNHDGKIDASDALWQNLTVWVDADHDGVSTATELHSLQAYGIASIGTGYVNNLTDCLTGCPLDGGVTKIDGTTALIADRTFDVDMIDTLVTVQVSVPADIAALPNATGYGKVRDLQQAMAMDSTGVLKGFVEKFGTEVTQAGREALMTQILLNWTNSQNIDPHSRDNTFYGTQYDARKLNVIEQFNGEGLVNLVADSGRVETDPMPQSVPLLDQSYNAIFEMTYAQLMAQTHLSAVVGLISVGFDSATASVTVDTSATVAALGEGYVANPTAGLESVSEFIRFMFGSNALPSVVVATTVNHLAEIDANVAAVITAIVANQPNIWLNGSIGDDVLVGMTGADFIFGGSGNDTINGGFGTDYVSGDDGNDVLNGDTGDDGLFGGAGSDMLGGGFGNDNLTGGADNDVYIFDKGDGQDMVLDIGTATGDSIRFGTGIGAAQVSVSRGTGISSDDRLEAANFPTFKMAA